MTDTPTTDRIEAEYGVYTDVAALNTVRTAYEARLTEIDSSPDLTEQGKRTESARAYKEAEAAVDAARATFETRVDMARHTAERRLFGPGATDPATLLAHRDALDRAAKLKNPDKASEALHRARFSGDEGMVRAITMQAHRWGWNGVLGAVEVAAPGTAAKLAAYEAIPASEGLAYNRVFGLRAPKYFVSKLDGAVDTYNINRAARGA